MQSLINHIAGTVKDLEQCINKLHYKEQTTNCANARKAMHKKETELTAIVEMYNYWAEDKSAVEMSKFLKPSIIIANAKRQAQDQIDAECGQLSLI